MSEPGASGGVGLDPDLARVAIARLEGLRQKLMTTRFEAVQLALTQPSAFDAVSLESFRLLREKADGGPGSLTWALDGGIEYIDRVIDQLHADLAQLVDQDGRAAQTIVRP